jgi:hypothetical protein
MRWHAAASLRRLASAPSFEPSDNAVPHPVHPPRNRIGKAYTRAVNATWRDRADGTECVSTWRQTGLRARNDRAKVTQCVMTSRGMCLARESVSASLEMPPRRLR